MITRITNSHAGFDAIEDIARNENFQGFKGGIAVLNLDDPFSPAHKGYRVAGAQRIAAFERMAGQNSSFETHQHDVGMGVR